MVMVFLRSDGRGQAGDEEQGSGAKTKSLQAIIVTNEELNFRKTPGLGFWCETSRPARGKMRGELVGGERLVWRRRPGCCSMPPTRPSSPPTPAPTLSRRSRACSPAKLLLNFGGFLTARRCQTTLSSSSSPLPPH